jgi:cytochrome c-type biogenesis protein
MDLTGLIALPIAFGLFGFIEPCYIGASLLFIKALEDQEESMVRHVLIFAITRAAFIGSFGILAAVAGTAALEFQKFGWLALGILYLAIGLFYITGKSVVLNQVFGAVFKSISKAGGGAGLGVVFGLNIPACAAPLILALVGTIAMNARSMIEGFVSLALFGFALTLPLVVVVFWQPGRALLMKLSGLSERIPIWAGLLFVGLGVWSMYFWLFVEL